MIIRARSVVTMDGAPIANGALAIKGNRIAEVGAWPDVARRNSGDVLDLGERVLLPGLINAHCHLDYTDMRGAIPPQRSFTDWIRAINAHKANWKPKDYLNSIRRGFAEAMKFGTTSLVNFEAFPELITQLEEASIRTWWFAEMIDVRQRVSVAEVVAQLEGACDQFGLAPHAPFTASADLYSEATRAGALLSTHLAESREEMEMFRDVSGPLFDFLKSIGRPMQDCGGTTPLALLLRRGVLDERWLVAHLNEVTDADLELLPRASRFHVVHCPRSHAYFGHAPFRFHELRNQGFNICLGTDSLASNQDLSLFAEMRAFRKTFADVPVEQALAMVTVHPAAALRCGKSLGRLQTGFLADVIAVPFTGNEENLFDEIVAFNGPVSWLMTNGTPNELPS